MLGVFLLATFANTLVKGIDLIVSNKTDSIVLGITTSSDPDTDPEESIEVPSLLELPSDQFVFTSDLIIKAINPGYTIDGTQNVGEFIELQKTTDAPLSLANYSIRYITSSGKYTTLLNFSEGSSLVGEFLLMRLARSPESINSDLTYMTTLAMSAGTVEILYHDTVIDSVCWANKSETCVDSFRSNTPTTLVRDANTGIFQHLDDYLPHFDLENPSLIISPPKDNGNEDASGSIGNPSIPDSSIEEDSAHPSSRCYGLEFSEILSYYTNDKTEQFIELYNPTERNIDLSFCNIRYKNKSYRLSGIIDSNSHFAIYPSKFSPSLSLTKNPSSSNTIELVDSDQSVVDVLVYSHGQKKSTSYAKFYDAFGGEIWESTFANTPGAENIFQEFRTCPSDKTINPDTGNCVKVSTKIDDSLAECPAGKYRNPLTGRCKNIDSGSSELKPCAAGYERNPETNRCRKVVAENDGAGYALVPTTSSSKSTFIALGAVISIAFLGVVYIILQFRREIIRAIRKLKQRLHHIGKNLISRRIRFG